MISHFLIVAKGIMELHGGSLRASSKGEGKGSCFSIELPTSIPPPEVTQELVSIPWVSYLGFLQQLLQLPQGIVRFHQHRNSALFLRNNSQRRSERVCPVEHHNRASVVQDNRSNRTPIPLYCRENLETNGTSEDVLALNTINFISTHSRKPEEDEVDVDEGRFVNQSSTDFCSLLDITSSEHRSMKDAQVGLSMKVNYTKELEDVSVTSDLTKHKNSEDMKVELDYQNKKSSWEICMNPESFDSRSEHTEEKRNERKLPSVKNRVLIVDDVPMTRKMLRRLLMSRFDICDEAGDGRQAVEMVKLSFGAGSSGYDVITMDYQMPLMDGVTATRIIRQLGYTGKIIAVTGNAVEDDMLTFKASGADAVLMKPLDIKEFDLLVRPK